jgi:hypothetical protein
MFSNKSTKSVADVVRDVSDFFPEIKTIHLIILSNYQILDRLIK